MLLAQILQDVQSANFFTYMFGCNYLEQDTSELQLCVCTLAQPIECYTTRFHCTSKRAAVQCMRDWNAFANFLGPKNVDIPRLAPPLHSQFRVNCVRSLSAGL
jgi:hypothetical protein